VYISGLLESEMPVGQSVMTFSHQCPAEGAHVVEARELRYFLALAEDLHFGHAAQRLSIAAPALSRAMRRFETELGVTLFRRDTHGVELTEAGQALMGSARNALASFDGALAAARETGQLELTGLVNVGVSPLMRHGLGPAIFERFAAICPAVRVARREEFSGPLVEELGARRIDVALAFCPPRHDGLVYERIRDAELAILIASSHPLAGRSRVNLFELREEPFLMPSVVAAPDVRRRFAELFATAGFQPRYSSRAIDYDEEMAAVREGCGVAVISRFFLEATPVGTTLLRPDPPLSLDFELVRRAESPFPPLTHFIEVVEEVGARLSRPAPCPPAAPAL
jgi:DNA-binding transcriptional LysR family regulator